MNTPVLQSYADLAIFDYQLLVDRLMGDQEITQLILCAFMKNIGPKIRKLQDHAENNDIPVLLKQAHSIKGAAGSISALALHRMAIDLEAAGKMEDTAEIKKLTQLISTHYDSQLRTILEQQTGV
jgi:histidine phosphotransfer protein HptB